MKRGICTAVMLAMAVSAAAPAIAQEVRIYAAAVVKEPLGAIVADYEKATGGKVTLVFDTAGAAERRFEADAGATLLITSTPLIAKAQDEGGLKDGRSSLIGSTFAGVAVRPGSGKPDLSSPEKLRAALLAARRIAVSDPARGATVGTHFMKVVEALGVKDEVTPKIKLSRDGVETVRLVVAGEADLGVSQSSEIMQASPDALAGPFPGEYALRTSFSLWHRTALSPGAADIVARLMAPAGREELALGGIVPDAGAR